MISADNTQIFTFVNLHPLSYLPGSNNLWSYHKQGIINGVPVRLVDKGLNIDTLKLLANAFDLNSLILIWSGWLSPDYPLNLIKYKEIKQLEVENKCLIIDQQMQYSTAKDAYLILITYANLQFQLNDRYSFYKLDLIHE